MGLSPSIDPLHPTKLGSVRHATPKSPVQSQFVLDDEMGQVMRQCAHESITGNTKLNAIAHDAGYAFPTARPFGLAERCAPWVGSDAERPTRASYRRAFAHLVARTAAAIETVCPDNRCRSHRRMPKLAQFIRSHLTRVASDPSPVRSRLGAECDPSFTSHATPPACCKQRVGPRYLPDPAGSLFSSVPAGSNRVKPTSAHQLSQAVNEYHRLDPGLTPPYCPGQASHPRDFSRTSAR